MLSNLFGSVLDDLIVYSSADNNSNPTEDWVVSQTIRLLQQYPSGVSRPVLLTELEHRWRMNLKRGEHVGKLKQAIVTKQLSLADTFTGDLTAIDEYRFEILRTVLTVFANMARGFCITFIRTCNISNLLTLG